MRLSEIMICLSAEILSFLANVINPDPLVNQVLTDFPHTTAELSIDCLLDLFPEIQPRSFSIASSLLVNNFKCIYL